MIKENFNEGDIVTIKGDNNYPPKQFIVESVGNDNISLVYNNSTNNYVETAGIFSSILFTKNELEYIKIENFNNTKNELEFIRIESLNNPPQIGDVVSLKTNDDCLYVVYEVRGLNICAMRFDYNSQKIYKIGFINYRCFNKWELNLK